MYNHREDNFIMDKYAEILMLIEKGDESNVIDKARSYHILLDIIDNESNTLLHLAARSNMRNLAEETLKEDKSKATMFNGQELNRIINDQNDADKTALDLCTSPDMKNLIKESGGKTGLEIKIEFEEMESLYYSSMEDVSKIQTAHVVGNEIFQAIKLNDFEEFKRLYELGSREGGLLLFRFTAKNKEGFSFMEYAETLNRKEIIDYLNTKL